MYINVFKIQLLTSTLHSAALFIHSVHGNIDAHNHKGLVSLLREDPSNEYINAFINIQTRLMHFIAV